MKKITFIAESIYPFNKGGAEKRIFDYSSILANDTSNNIRIVSKKWWTNESVNDKGNIQYIGICKKSKMYKDDGKRDVTSSIRFGVATFFYVLRGDDDILDIDIFPYFPLIFAKLATFFKKKKPTIICYWAEYWGKDYWKRYYNLFWWTGVILEKISFLACDKIIVNSNFTGDKLQNAFDCNGKVIDNIAPVTIDIDEIDKVKCNKKIYDMIYYGRIIKHKHVEHIIDMVEKFRKNKQSVKVLLIGDGPDKRKIKNKINKRKLSNDVDIINFVDKYTDLIQYVKSAKIMLQPSEREGFGITAIEANACGLPVIIVDYPDNAMKDLIQNNYNGFICVSADDLHSKARLLIGDGHYKTLEKMAQNSRNVAREYSHERMRKRINSYYQNL